MLKIRIKYLGFFLALISLLSFLNILYSYYFNLYLNLNTYFYTFLSSAFFSFIFFGIKSPTDKPNIFDRILTISFGYLFIPIILSIPFYFSIYNLTYLNAFFESVSGFTSTGFSIFENIKHIDQSLIMWRSTTQWVGGLYFLFSIIFLIDIYDENLKGSLTNFIAWNKSEIIKQSVKIFILYLSLTFLIFLILEISGLRTFNSLNLALSLISSGGFLPFNDISIILNSNLKKLIFSFLMLVSFFSIFFIYNLIFFKKRNKNFFYEDYNLLIYLISLVLIFFLFFSHDNDFVNLVFSIFSSISNIGISLDFDSSNLHFIFLLLVIIGGSFFSTSSGLRFIRIYSLVKFSLNQILSFSKPRNIFMNKLLFSNTNLGAKEINKYFLSIIIFMLSLFVLTSLLTLSGIDFEECIKIAILTLMNTVNSSAYGITEFNFQNIHFFSKFCLILFMIIGRIELLTLLLVIKKYLFKN
tara:strand:- start:242 stop:1648 length:1407 start_codon:yes stop_codon:yes gene_type:complete